MIRLLDAGLRLFREVDRIAKVSLLLQAKWRGCRELRGEMATKCSICIDIDILPSALAN